MKNIQKIILLLTIVLLPFSISFSLPVELSYFAASVNLNIVTLNWGTTFESNNSGFRIERIKADSTNWIEVGFVPGNGTTNKPHDYIFLDSGLMNGSYNYRLKQMDFNGSFKYHTLNQIVTINNTAISYLSISIDGSFKLFQNYPNPFNPTTKINYELPASPSGRPITNYVTLKIYDIGGREVSTLVNDIQIAGYYTLNFNGSNLASGTYFYRLVVSQPNPLIADANGHGEFVASKKMVILK